MFGTLNRSWELVKETWDVLRQDRELVFFPILSGIVSLFVSASFLIPIALMVPWQQLGQSGSRAADLDVGPLHYGLMFLYYLVSYFVVVFFNAGLVACVRIRFQGGDPTVSDGLNFSFKNIGLIFQWALLAATVGTVLRSIEERAGWLGQIVIGLIGLAWTIATSFVVPVLVYDGVNPIEAVKRSALAFKRTWGETVVVNFGINTVFNLLFLPSILVLVAGGIGAGAMAQTSPLQAGILFATVLGICILYWLALAIVQTALQGIFLTACYHYASTGQVPSAFTPTNVTQAWRPKGK
ncbi:MAG: hypothetical protein K0Q72_2788 [Armatimonadetes bacterium]|jgi:hypothetical protein|nr:hypothetical protein [Armatimonadota bacterium]